MCVCGGGDKVQVCTRPVVGISFAILHVVTDNDSGVYQRVPFAVVVRHSLLHVLPRDCFLLRLFLYNLFLFFLFLTLLEFFAVRTEGICHKVFAWQHFPQIFMLFFICCKRLYFHFLSLVRFVCLTFIVGLVKQNS